MTITQTQLGTYRRCPRLHDLTYRLGYRPVAEDGPMRLGSLVHKALEALYRGAPWVWPADADPWDLALARPMLASYTNGVGKAVAVEEEFCVQLGEGVQLSGRFDARTPDWLIEHKTTSRDASPGSVYAARLRMDTQASLYLWAAQRLGFGVRGIVYDVLRKPPLRPYQKLGKREVAETPADFEARVDAAIRAEPHRYYVRHIVVRLESELYEAVAEALQTAAAMRLPEAPRSTSACDAWGRLCEFFPVCSGEASLDDRALYRLKTRTHEELT